MSFIADRQTLDDLRITGKFRPGSIFSLFNQVRTAGGEKLLEYMFSNPLSDPEEINKRSRIFHYFQQKSLSFPFDAAAVEDMSSYLEGAAATNLLSAMLGNFRKLVLGWVVKDEQYAALQHGLQSTIAILTACRELFGELERDGDTPYRDQVLLARKIVEDKRLDWLGSEKASGRLTFFPLTRWDHLLRHTLRAPLEMLIVILHYLDVSIAVGQVAAAHHFSYANALPKERNWIHAEQLSHPSLAIAVGNTLSFSRESNMIFLTGANMAGKSTLMKSFGIALYLAHMGFPVAAREMEFSIKDGIYSSINVPDSLKMGYSHFYAEVLRVKKVAEEVSGSKDMIVLFDELFKGTNVKDAYDATLAVTEAFSAYRNCFFMISTHIIEVGEALRRKCSNIRFVYLATVMEGTTPRYTYQLEEGITADRQGMIIIEKEGILEMLFTQNNVQRHSEK
ncbi:MAG TPA: DNA mismatch repair protein [Puia sp.]|jgi:DNA mismatch repair ATPase MutS|nr:DNA mismatch repair protein [Puia sp.]